MTITWYGHSCFRIETRGLTLAIDPFPKSIGLTPPRFRAEILLVTHQHPAHANVGAIAGSPVLIAGPGEYEVGGIEIRGIPTYHDSRGGGERGRNTAYAITAERMRLLHLGDYGEASLRPEVGEAIGAVDLVFVPVGGRDTIGARLAAELIGRLEPAIAIPMHYRIPGLDRPLDPLEPFLKELGASRPEPLPKLTVKSRELAVAGQLRVLTPAGGEARPGRPLAAA